jgi:ribonuclease P protein component
MAPDRPLGRLARETDFRRVYRTGTRRSTALVVIHALPNPSGEVRLGLAVGRRFGRAVSRNRLRRRLREAVRAYRAAIRGGADVVLTPRDAAPRAAFGELHAAVGEALAAAGLLGAGPGSSA